MTISIDRSRFTHLFELSESLFRFIERSSKPRLHHVGLSAAVIHAAEDKAGILVRIPSPNHSASRSQTRSDGELASCSESRSGLSFTSITKKRSPRCLISTP